MRTLVIGSKKTHPTAQKIAESLDCSYTNKPEGVNSEFDLIFRYGNSFTPIYGRVNHIINQAWAINQNADKIYAREKLISDGIRAPRLFNSFNITPENLPVIARPRNHFKGRRFYILEDIDKVIEFAKKGYYLQEIIEKENEFRIFVFKDKIMEINIKTQEDQDKDKFVDYPKMVRSFKFGWIMKRFPISETDRELKLLARAALTNSGLDFGAVDCCIEKDTNLSWVFEINSAPGLIDRKIKLLKTYITRYYEL